MEEITKLQITFDIYSYWAFTITGRYKGDLVYMKIDPIWYSCCTFLDKTEMYKVGKRLVLENIAKLKDAIYNDNSYKKEYHLDIDE